jgi:trehalose 6-phosphate phosphatase
MANPPPLVDTPLFFLDYDGTLAPIVEDPMKAFPHPDIPAILAELDRRYPLWVVTGRQLQDLELLLDLGLQAVGLHGAQQGTLGGSIESASSGASDHVLRELRATVPDAEGIRVEDKGHTFALHYRLAPDESSAVAALRRWARSVPPGIDQIWGKKVLELRPAGISKGVAVRRIAREHPSHIPVYLGDDVTDEDAFRALDEPAVTVKIGEGETAARYRLPDVDAAARYLRAYLRA